MTREKASGASQPGRRRESGEAARGDARDPASRGGAPTAPPAGRGGTPRGNDPRIVAFMCSWCAYAAADRAGQGRVEIPHSLLTIRVMCTGRVEPAFVLQALREGADGVLIAGCHPGDCHYVDGNLRAAARHAVLVHALEQAGIEPARFRIVWAGANDAEKLATAVREMTDDLAALGPLDYAGRALDAAGLAELAAPGEPPAAGRPDGSDAARPPARVRPASGPRRSRRAGRGGRAWRSTGTPPAAAARRRWWTSARGSPGSSSGSRWCSGRSRWTSSGATSRRCRTAGSTWPS